MSSYYTCTVVVKNKNENIKNYKKKYHKIKTHVFCPPVVMLDN